MPTSWSPPASAADKARLSQLAKACAAAAQRGDDATQVIHEAEINQIVYRLFDLMPEEIVLIESALDPPRTSSPSRKRAKVVPSARPQAAAAIDDDDALPMPVLIATPAKPLPAKALAQLTGELFSLDDELPLQPKKSTRALQPVPSPSIVVVAKCEVPDKDELLARVRDVLAEHGPCDRATAIREVLHDLGFQRTGTVIGPQIDNAIRTAVGRRILFNEGNELSVNRASLSAMDDNDRDFMKKQFLAAISAGGKVWIERKDAAIHFARWFGLRRTGGKITATAKSLINGLIRDKRLESHGTRIRRV